MLIHKLVFGTYPAVLNIKMFLNSGSWSRGVPLYNNLYTDPHVLI